MISFTQRGNFSKVTQYLERVRNAFNSGILDKYGRAGVSALAAMTPIETGETASSWYYETANKNGVASVTFYNSHVNEGVPIAIILQYGHGTGTGGWVEGRDYINPAIQPLFDDLVAEAWEEVSRL